MDKQRQLEILAQQTDYSSAILQLGLIKNKPWSPTEYEEIVMSEKQQHTAAHMREQMTNRYGDGLHHKHNKNHNAYRLHCKTHPAQLNNDSDQEKSINCSTGLLHKMNLRKIRKRLAKGRFH